MNDRDLVMAAAVLARGTPEPWRKFVDALGEYTESRCVECIQAQSDMLQVAQGRAQGLVALLRSLDTCIKTAESIDKSDRRK